MESGEPKEIKDIHPKERESWVDFFNMSEEERNRLHERIKKSGGRIFIFVHPYYHEAVEQRGKLPMVEEVTPQARRRVWAIEKAIKKVARLPSRQTIPFFIMEEEDHIPHLQQRVNRLPHSFDRNEFYFIPTEEDDSLPIIPTPSNKRDDKWEYLRSTLRSFGVTKILVGGQRFDVHKISFGMSPRLIKNYCVGITLTNLEKYFDVSLTELSAPHALSAMRALLKKEQGSSKA